MTDIRAAVVAEIARLQNVLRLLDEKVEPRPERKNVISQQCHETDCQSSTGTLGQGKESSSIAKGLISPVVFSQSPSSLPGSLDEVVFQDSARRPTRDVQPTFGSIFSNFAIFARMSVTVTSPPVTARPILPCVCGPSGPRYGGTRPSSVSV